MVAGITFRPYTPATILDGAALLEELAQVRRQGYAYDREEREAGLFCVSAPILTAGGTCAAAVSVSLPAGRIGQHDVGELTRAVCQAAGEISARLGSR